MYTVKLADNMTLRNLTAEEDTFNSSEKINPEIFTPSSLSRVEVTCDDMSDTWAPSLVGVFSKMRLSRFVENESGCSFTLAFA